jgi:hypothetical protein
MIPLLLSLVVVTGAEPQNATTKQQLFKTEAWYQNAGAAETAIKGVVEFNPGNGRIGASDDFPSFRLISAEDAGIVSRPIHMAGKDHLLALFHSHQVTLKGKLIDREVDGTKVKEIWPAELEVHGRMPTGVIADYPILARSAANANHFRAQGPQWLVLRDSKELNSRLPAIGVPNVDRTQQIAASFQLPKIDWDKQMIIHIGAGVQRTNGVQIEISKLQVGARGLTVHWKMALPQVVVPGYAYPAQTILVPKFKGDVIFVEDGKDNEKVIPFQAP